MAQFGGSANLEYGQIISGTVWWVCQFGIESNNFWHSLVDVPIFNTVKSFLAHSLVDVPVLNRVKSFLAQFGGCASLE